jgi:hypothetical protein
MTNHEKERALYREIAPQVERGLPGVEVLALELAGAERFCVYIDHPQGVDHALCERVTGALRRGDPVPTDEPCPPLRLVHQLHPDEQRLFDTDFRY